MPTKKNIATPEKLYEHFEKYSTECKATPKKENLYNMKANVQVSVEREIPLTWEGFEVWLRRNDVIVRLDDYKSDKDDRYTEYADIIHAIGLEIYEDKFVGATVGIYQHNIIARDLGLADKKQHEGIDGEPLFNKIEVEIVKPKGK